MGETTRSVSWGVVVLIVALGLFFVAAGVIAPGSEVPVASPMVVAMAGMVLAAGGIALMLSSTSRLRLPLVAVMLAGFAAIGGWIAFNGTAETISGGVAFLTREENALLGRLTFGMGAVLSVLVLFLVLRQLRGGPDA
jgi:hypothetical protein